MHERPGPRYRVDIDNAHAHLFRVTLTIPRPAARQIVALPMCNFAEEDGTFTNLRGRVQRFQQAKAPPAQVRPSYRGLGELASAIGAGTYPALASDVFATIAANVPAFAGMTYRTLGLQGSAATLAAGATV